MTHDTHEITLGLASCILELRSKFLKGPSLQPDRSYSNTSWGAIGALMFIVSLCFLLCCACVINLFKEKQLQLGHWDYAPTIVWKVGGSLISCGGKSFPEGRYLKSWSVHLNAMRLSVPGSVLYNRAPWLEGVNHVRLGLLCIVTCWSRHFMTSIGFPLPLPVFSRAIHEL